VSAAVRELTRRVPRAVRRPPHGRRHDVAPAPGTPLPRGQQAPHEPTELELVLENDAVPRWPVRPVGDVASGRDANTAGPHTAVRDWAMRLTHVLAASAALGILAGCKREPAPSPPVPNPGDAGVVAAGRDPTPEAAPPSSPLTVTTVASANAAATATAVVPSIGIAPVTRVARRWSATAFAARHRWNPTSPRCGRARGVISRGQCRVRKSRRPERRAPQVHCRVLGR
jgi:hypothetical protein